MNARYLGWVKLRGGWVVVCNGATVAECMGALLRWIRGRPAPPVASAVRPAGQHPGDPDTRHGTPAVAASSDAVRGNGRARGSQRRQGRAT
jgi:hypothetical protein